MATKTSKTGRKNQYYSWAFKRQVILECLERGSTQAAAGIKYGVSDRLVQNWLKGYVSDLDARKVHTFKSMTAEEQKQYDALKQQNDILKKELELAQMKAKAMEIMINLAKEEYGIDIRKNSGARQPAKSNNTTRRQQ
jgi:transposase-like protein